MCTFKYMTVHTHTHTHTHIYIYNIQIEKAAPHKKPDIRSLTSHLTNHLNKTKRYAGEIKTHLLLWRTPVLTDKQKIYLNQLFVQIGYRAEDLRKVIPDRD